MAEGWTTDWQPMIDAVGKDFGASVNVTAADEIEKGAIRKYCEPLEMDCPIFFDEEVARAHGYDGIVSPYSGISQTWLAAAMWEPGMETRYPAATARRAEPARPLHRGAQPLAGREPGGATV